MDVKVNIRAAEWAFEEEIPFDVVAINVKQESFSLPLFDEEGNETDSIELPNCSILEITGEEDEFNVVMETNVIEEEDQYEDEEGVLVKSYTFFVDKPLWRQGEDIGVFYSWENLPEELKNFRVRNHEQD